MLLVHLQLLRGRERPVAERSVVVEVAARKAQPLPRHGRDRHRAADLVALRHIFQSHDVTR